MAIKWKILALKMKSEVICLQSWQLIKGRNKRTISAGFST
jgi:hypothetical protein